MDGTEVLGGLLAASIGVVLVVLLVVIAWLVFYVIGLWKLFVKAGRPGWAAIVPYYNNYVLIEMVGLKIYWFFIYLGISLLGFFVDGALAILLNIASIVVSVNIYYNLSKKLGKDTGWIVLMVFFGGIVLPISGYNKDVFNAAAPVTPNGLFDGLGGNNNAPVQNGQVVQGVQPVQPQPMQQPMPQPMDQQMPQQPQDNQYPNNNMQQ